MTDLSGVDPNVNPDPGNYILNQRRAAQGAMVGALDSNPDDAARALTLAEATGAHPALVDANLEDFEKQHKTALTSQILNNNPYLRDYVNSHPLAAKVSNDDFGQLDVVSHHVTRFGDMGVMDKIAHVFKTNLTTSAEIAKAAYREASETGGTITSSRDVLPLAKSSPTLFRFLEALELPFDPGHQMSAVMKGIEGGIAEAYKQVTGDEYSGKRLAAELMIFPQTSMVEFMKPTVPHEMQAAAKAAKSAKPFLDAGVAPPVGVDPIIDQAHVEQSKLDLENLSNALRESQRSATRERNPEMFARFIRAHTNSRISVSAEAVRKLYGERTPAPDDGILGWAPDIGDQLRIAEAGGGHVEIPLADWLAKVDPGVAKELHDDIRVRGNGLTLNEVKELGDRKPVGEPAAQRSEGEVEPSLVPEVDSLRRSSSLEPLAHKSLSPTFVEEANLEDRLGLSGGQWVNVGKSNRIYVKLADQYTAYEKQIHEAVNEVASRIFPKDVEYGGGHALLVKGQEAHGVYQEFKESRPVILWSLNAEDATAVARHEAIHSLYRGGFFTKEEWATLKAEAVKGEWIKKHDIVARYPGEELSLHLEEAIAEEYAAWAKTDKNAGSVHPIFERMKQLILELRDKIKDIIGEEPTADKLFEKVEAGVIRDREGTGPRDPGAFREPAAQRPPIQGELDVTRLEDKDAFAKANALGMTTKQYAKYQELIAKRDAEDTAYGAKKAEKEIARRQTAEWKDAAEKIREEVRPDITSRPDIAADEFLREGRLYRDKIKGRPRLDVDRLTPKQKAALPKDYYGQGGLHPDDVAGLFGYPTGEALIERLGQLVRDRGEAGPKEYVNRLVDDAVERRMQAEHGDLAENILEEAKDHVISQTQLDMLHEEMVGLGTRAGGEIEISKADVKRWVKQEFDRQPISAHSAERYLRDAGRAGTIAERALLEDKPKDAFKAKQQQYISVLMANEAKALEKAQKSFERNAKFMSRREVPNVQQDYTNFIHDILTRVGKPVRRSVQDLAGTIAAGEWASLEEFVYFKQQHDLREVPVADFLFDPNFRKEFGSLTAEEFHAVHDSVKALLKNGRDEKQIYKAGEAADLQVVKDQLVGELKEFQAKKRLDPDTITGKMKHYARTFLAAHLQLESLFNRWDRGDPQGAWTQYVMRDLASAANSEAALERKYSRMVATLADKADLREKVRNTIFFDPFTFERDAETGRMGPGQNSELLPFTRKNLRAVLQNAGNASNLEKLAKGYGLTPDLVMAWLHKYATKADWDWAQKQGDIFKEIKVESDRMYRNLTDIEPEGVEIQPIQTPHGTYPGWYHPVVYDPVWEGSSKKMIGGDPLEQDNYVRATTPAGYTKARTAYTAPMSLYLDQTPARMKQMLHDIAFRPAVINASKIFYDKDVRAAIAKHYGPEYRDLLVPWLKDVANSSNSRSDVQKVGATVSEFFRQNMIATLIGFNPGTVMKHGPTAAMNSLTEVGPANFAKAVAGLFSKNEATGETNWRFAMDTSEELGRRHRHYVETIKGADEKVMGTSSMRETMIKLGAYPVAFSDLLSAVPTWLAKYESSMREGADHGTAVFDADRAVRRAHGSSVITNRPAVMRGGAMAQWMSSLYGFFSHILNRQFEMAWTAKDTLGLAKEGNFKEATANLPGLSAMFFSYVVFPALIEELVTPLGNDERESWGVKASKAMAHSLSGSWIGIRDLVNGMVTGRDPSAGLFSTLLKTGADTARDLSKVGPLNKQHAGTFMQHFITMVGALTGLTNAQEGRVARFMYNYSTGQEKPKGFAQWWHGLRFGTTKPPRQ